MADLIIQPKNDDHLKLNNDAGTTILELANDESKLRLAQNNISASDGTTAITTSGANVTLAGTANNIGTVTSGTFNGTIGNSATFPTGHSVQVVSSTQTGEVTFLSSTPTAVSNLTKSITLKTDAPKILVILAINSGGKAFSNTALGINLTADSDTALNIQLTDTQGYTGDTGISFNSTVQVYLHELTSNDTVGDTITYTPKFFSTANSTQAGINAVYSTDDATSQIILMELTA